MVRPEIIGIMQSGYYTLVDGHIYHNNNVIKMRYDLMDHEHVNSDSLVDDEFFDIYNKIFPLRPGCRISSSNLMISGNSHRFAFLSEDTENQNLPNMFRVMPYLHERRVYLRTVERN